METWKKLDEQEITNILGGDDKWVLVIPMYNTENELVCLTVMTNKGKVLKIEGSVLSVCVLN